MKVAIYARYSSANQSEKSIDDQIRVCQKYIEENGYSFSEEHIFTDAVGTNSYFIAHTNVYKNKYFLE